MKSQGIEERRGARKKQSAEEFTPAWLVNEMLDKLPQEMWEEDKTCCDPACGNGNMLVEVLKRKLAKGHDPKKALSTLYGCDIMQDNIKECRLRLLKLISTYTTITSDMVKIVFNNIVWLCLKRYPQGALDYSFKFPIKASLKDIEPWMDNMHRWLRDIDVDKGVNVELHDMEEYPIMADDDVDEDDFPRLFGDLS